jgi:hypothetical protein
VGLDATVVEKLWSSFLQSDPGTRYTDILCLAHLLHWTRQHGLALPRSSRTCQPDRACSEPGA